ncbi:hypothetical protein BJX63DRAFT_396275 [Aspergillus granulosus]|uniref:Uncharacterized protein n=1 Tax=Aspergillus granulosus TaxID=176169 RepID=A0ABR4HB40_9EURO
MLWTIDILICHVCYTLGLKISRKRAYRMLQTWIKGQICGDPEADVPELGVMPMWAFTSGVHEDIPDYIEIKELFGIRTTDGHDLRSYGESPNIEEIQAMIKDMHGDFDREKKSIKYECQAGAWSEFQDRRLCAILECCIKTREEALGPSGQARKPILRRAQVIGQQVNMPYTHKDLYLLADSTYTVGFKDNTGRVRDYFVVLKQQRMENQLPLILYMAIIHQRLKSQQRNCVVYGLHTDMKLFVFLKIDRNGEVLPSATFILLLANVTGAFRKPR